MASSQFLTPYHPITPVTSEQSGRSSLEQKPLRHDTNGERKIASDDNVGSPRQRRNTQSHQKLVFTDPVAFRYLEEDPATIVLDRRRRLQGYEIYIVEQWACSRTHPTFMICTYTGDLSHSILVNVLSIPTDQSSWSPRLKIYFQAVSQFHAREKDTPLGTVMVTNLSGFPSALTVITVPDGDVKKHREDFIVNENLKRMGCSGRAAINLQPPQQSTIAKFHQLYRTSEAVPLYQSVMELVRLCQTSLVIYGKLEEAYVDGLLCDITEKAINDWWTEIGIYFFNIEPSDGILGPTTVAALLGLLIGACNRLKAAGEAVGKDVIDFSSMKRAVGHFQKSQKMEKSRRLDRETLDRLHRATAKSASGEGWIVPKAVKSTVAELSGKGGEMMMGIVGGGRDKAGISDAETLDIDRFAQLVAGPRMKWLWQGKQTKYTGDFFSSNNDELNGRIFSTDDQGNFLWTSSKQEPIKNHVLERMDTTYSHHSPEAKSGFGRIREAVGGLKTHNQRAGKEGEDHLDTVEELAAPSVGTRMKEQLAPAERSLTAESLGPPPLNMALREAPASPVSKNGIRQGRGTRSDQNSWPSYRAQLRAPQPAESPRKQKIRAEMAELRNEFNADVYQNFSAEFEYHGPRSKALRRSRSAIHIVDQGSENPRQHRLPRQVSFSIAENTVLGYRDVLEGDEDDPHAPDEHPRAALAASDAHAAVAQGRIRRLLRVQQALVPYTESKVGHVEGLNRDAQDHLEELNNLYYQRLEEYQTLRATSSDMVSQEKSALTESLRRVEMLGAKLDYELNALQSRMQEVQDGVDDFERSVIAIEARVKELTGDETMPTTPWFQRLLNLLGAKV